jgi:copper(I)-binding protein
MVSRSTGPLRTILPAVAIGLAALLVGCSAGQVTQTDSIEPAVNGNRADLGPIALRDVMIAYPESGRYADGDQAPLVLTIVNTGDSDDELVDVSSPVAEDVQLVGNTSLPANTALQIVVPEEPIETSSSAPPSTTGTSTPGSEAPTDTSVPEESITEPSAPADTGTGESESETAPSEPSDSEVTETPSSVPSSELPPDVVGMMSVVLILNQDLPVGRNFPVTFVFANAGQVTIQLPIASPATARHDAPDTEDEGH